MESSDVFLTIAEVAIAFAGFTGLIAVGWVFEPSFAVYLAALFWCLLGAAVGFVQFISLVWAGPHE